jgi:hypothetical protein
MSLPGYYGTGENIWTLETIRNVEKIIYRGF